MTETTSEPLALLRGIEALAASLEGAGLGGEASELRRLAEDRALWDRMALRVVKHLRNHVLDRVSGATREQALRLVAHLESNLPLALDEAVYQPIRRLAVDLERTGFRSWSACLERALQGSTGTEVFMALRQCLEEVMEDPRVSSKMKEKAEPLLATVQTGLAESA